MKFKLNHIVTNKKIRLGTIDQIERLPNVVFETPLLLMYTRGGSVPHLTKEVLDMVTNEKQIVQISLPTTIQMYEPLKKYKGNGISEFIGLKDFLSYVTVQDPAKQNPKGYNSKNTISVWGNSGRISLDPNKYMDLIEIFKPDFYQALCDGDTCIKSTKKRNFKSVDNTLSMFDVCRNRHNQSNLITTSEVLSVIEGGYDIKLRQNCLEYYKDKLTNGFVIDGLHNNGVIDDINFASVQDVISNLIKNISEDKFRIVHGCWNPKQIINLIEMGVDIVDSSFAYLTTERMMALCFQYKIITEDLDNSESNLTSIEIDLNDEKYFNDFSPLMHNCECLTCRKHTRSYIHHLVKTKELLASVLLMIHNLHHYLQFFQFLRNSYKKDKCVAIV